MAASIEMRVEPSAEPVAKTPRQVQREFRARLEAGARLIARGEASRDPLSLLDWGYLPRHRVDLFDMRFHLTGPRQNEDIRFFVAYVEPVTSGSSRAAQRIFARIFYKDLSLVWRSASHYARSEHENWIGKGDLVTVLQNGEEVEVSNEVTTDLPLEIQTALETLNREAKRIPYDDDAVPMVLRRGADDRIEPFADFTEPRRRAQADPRNRIHRGRPIARFTRRNDPTSLRFVRGYEPDFARGVLEIAHSKSRLYGGAMRRVRVVSTNREVQFLFLAGPRQAWIGSCQATTTELSSYGVRTIDVVVDDDLLVPGFEYHFIDEDEDPPVLVSQIPEGFAGAPSEVDASRADASAWLDAMPVIQRFRRQVLGEYA